MKIFLSAVSSQFRACRDALASDLRSAGATVLVQEDFSQHGGALLERIEDMVASAEQVILLIGDAFGCAPEVEDAPRGAPHASYSQWEYHFALGRRLDGGQGAARTVRLYFASPTFLASNPVAQTEEEAAWQRAFIAEIERDGGEHPRFESLDELRGLVRRAATHPATNPSRPETRG